MVVERFDITSIGQLKYTNKDKGTIYTIKDLAGKEKVVVVRGMKMAIADDPSELM